MKTILGIDEAGRGAVLGPLVLTGVLFEDRDEIFEELSSCGVCDSKILTAKRREELAGVVRKLKLRYKTFKISPQRIDKKSINDIEIEKSSLIINKLKPSKVYLDVPASGSGVKNYCSSVGDRCQHLCEIIGGNKLDHNNVVVAAASIIAKQSREEAVRGLYKKYGNFGSGYPSDPRTRKWLKSQKTGQWPDIVRTKWATLAKI